MLTICGSNNAAIQKVTQTGVTDVSAALDKVTFQAPCFTRSRPKQKNVEFVKIGPCGLSVSTITVDNTGQKNLQPIIANKPVCLHVTTVVDFYLKGTSVKFLFFFGYKGTRRLRIQGPSPTMTFNSASALSNGAAGL